MNKNKVVVISAVAAAVFSGSVMAANVYKDDTTDIDVYGYAKGAHKFVAHGKKNGVDASELRLGVKGKQQLNETFALTGQYEGQYNVYPQRYVSRQAWGGIDAGKYGAVSVGRQTGAVYDVMGMSDMAPGVLTGYAAENETLTSRSDSIIQYKNTFDNVDVKIQHKLETSGESLEGVKHGTGSAYGTSVIVHDLGARGSFVGGAYSEQKGTGQSHATNSIYSVGAGWTDGRVYTAATHTAGKDQKSKHFHDTEVIGQYTFDNGLTPSVGYVDTNYGGDNVKAVETGVTYAFNKNVSTFVDAGWDTTGGHKHQVKTGLKYAF